MSEPQHMVALAKANRVRLAQSALKRDIHAGLPIADALADERAQRMRIFDLLHAQLRWGPRRTRQTLAHLFIGERLEVRALTDRQREAVAEAVAADQRRRDLAA